MKGISSNYMEVDELIDPTSDYIPVLLLLSSNIIAKQKTILLTNKKKVWFYSEIPSKIHYYFNTTKNNLNCSKKINR